MFGLKVITITTFNRVTEAADRAAFENLQHGAASVRLTEIESIKTSAEPSPEGTPPHTRAEEPLPKAIVFAVDYSSQEALIGPRFSVVGPSAAAHEFGGEFRGEQFDERPFALPALLEAAPRFGESFAGSIGE